MHRRGIYVMEEVMMKIKLVDGRNIDAEPSTGISNPDVETAIAIQPDSRYHITRVELWTGRGNAKQLKLIMGIREDNSGLPGQLVREAETLVVDPEDGWYGVDFPEPYPVSPGKPYWLSYMGETGSDTPIKHLKQYQGYQGDAKFTLPFSGLDLMFRTPRASNQWVKAHPQATEDVYFWSLSGEHWQGPFRGAHMLRTYGYHEQED
jgi:hypothetical protein